MRSIFRNERAPHGRKIFLWLESPGHVKAVSAAAKWDSRRRVEKQNGDAMEW